MKIINPSSNKYIQERNLLLQKELRDQPLNFSISEEYPLVLGQNFSYSYCVINDNDEIIAHANFIEKNVVDKNNSFLYKVGLIGNVVSRKEFRNQGIIRELFSYLENKAKNMNILALLLWSNLDEFYPKLGFKKIGNEYLFEITNKDNQNNIISNNDLSLLNDFNEKNLSLLLEKRFKIPITLERTPEDYSYLVKTANLNIFIRYKNHDIENFYIIGKGYDMQGVIHEYGSSIKIEDILYIKSILNLSKIYILTSCYDFIVDSLFKDREKLERYNINYSFIQQNMGWSLDIKKDSSYNINDLYVWGMDSI